MLEMPHPLGSSQLLPFSVVKLVIITKFLFSNFCVTIFVVQLIDIMKFLFNNFSVTILVVQLVAS